MNELMHVATHAGPTSAQIEKKETQRTQSRARMRRKRALAGPTRSVSFEIPVAVAAAASRLLTGSRRGFSQGFVRAYLKGAMMDVCAGQSDIAAVLGNEFRIIKDYLASLDE